MSAANEFDTYLVLKYGSLSECVDNGRIPEDLIPAIIREICNHPEPFPIYSHELLHFIFYRCPDWPWQETIERHLLEYEQSRN